MVAWVLYCSSEEGDGESLWACGGVVNADVVKWACVREKVLVCISSEIGRWCEVDCDCVNEMAVAAVVEECVWLVLGKKVEW